MATSNQTESMNRPLVILMISWLAIVCALGVGWWFTAEQDGRGITADNAAKIRKGMTRTEVVRILGCEPGWYYGPQHKWSKFFYSNSGRRAPELWLNSPNGITVEIDFDGQVVTSVKIATSLPDSALEPTKPPTIPIWW